MNKLSLYNMVLLLSILLFSKQAFSQNPDITFNVSSYAGGYNVSCHGATDGSIDATIAGGTAPYTYQ